MPTVTEKTTARVERWQSNSTIDLDLSALRHPDLSRPPASSTERLQSRPAPPDHTLLSSEAATAIAATIHSLPITAYTKKIDGVQRVLVVQGERHIQDPRTADKAAELREGFKLRGHEGWRPTNVMEYVAFCLDQPYFKMVKLAEKLSGGMVAKSGIYESKEEAKADPSITTFEAEKGRRGTLKEGLAWCAWALVRDTKILAKVTVAAHVAASVFASSAESWLVHARNGSALGAAAGFAAIILCDLLSGDLRRDKDAFHRNRNETMLDVTAKKFAADPARKECLLICGKNHQHQFDPMLVAGGWERVDLAELKKPTAR